LRNCENLHRWEFGFDHESPNGIEQKIPREIQFACEVRPEPFFHNSSILLLLKAKDRKLQIKIYGNRSRSK
jgi:hypothetical protein